MKVKLISFVIGTRPEAIKLACLINLLKNDKKFKIKVILTGQHEELVYSVMDIFQIKYDLIFPSKPGSANLSKSFSKILNNLDREFCESIPDLVIVQGDTTSAFAGALAAYYNQIPVGHVEAGLRTNSLYEPFPEEGNRRLISQIANLHFAPTKKASIELNKSGINSKVYITGNTVIDSLKFIVSKKQVFDFDNVDLRGKKFIIATVHRRENWGEKLSEIANALMSIIEENKDIFLLFPLHPNKNVSKPIKRILENHPRIFLIKSLDYLNFVSALNSCHLILTDSGGLQEEAPALDKPVLVLRNTSERSEGLEAGVSKLIGNSYEKIVYETNKILNSEFIYNKMSKSRNPFGDGNSCKKIKKIIDDFLK